MRASSSSRTADRPSSSKKSVEFAATGKTMTATDLRIVNAVHNLQNLVNTEAKWRNRVVSAVTTSSAIDLSVEKMMEFTAQCEERIASLRGEVQKIAEKQLMLVSFDPTIYKQWFEQLGSDPSAVTAPPAVAAAYASQARPGTSSSGHSSSSKRGHHRDQHPGQQVLDGIPVPEGFWKRREQQKNALAAVFLAVFDLPRLHRERPGAKPATAAEMLFHLKEATRLSASGPAALKELLNEYRVREKEIAAGNAVDRTAKLKGGASAARGAAKGGARAAAAAAGGGAAGASGRPSTAGSNASGDGISMKSCLQTGIFLHDPSSDEFALSTDLRPSDFFDLGSPRCLDQRVLHRVMALRSRKLRLEECITVFQDERAQLLKRQDLQKEVCGLGQYSLFAVRPLIEQTAAEEKALQRQRMEELNGDDLMASRRFGSTINSESAISPKRR